MSEGAGAHPPNWMRLGVSFDARADGGPAYDLGREGGHSQRRVLHASDITGQRVETALLARVRSRTRTSASSNTSP